MVKFGTSELSRAIAGGDFGIYLFEGMKPNDNSALHLTSTNFDEPRAFAFVALAESCVSIHGYAEDEHSRVCVGGAERMARVLRNLDLADIEEPCLLFPGSAPLNIVNRCRGGGVQLELSSALRRKLARNPVVATRLAMAIREAMVGTIVNAATRSSAKSRHLSGSAEDKGSE